MQGSIDTFAPEIADRRLVLANVQLARVLSVGSSWTQIRFGSRVSIDTTTWVGTNQITADTTSRFYYGMLSNPAAGLTNGPLTDTTSHFVGFISIGAGATLNQLAGGGANYRGTSSQNAYGKKIGATVTTTAGTADTPTFSSSPALRRTILIVDLEKSGANMIINFIALDLNTVIGDTTTAGLVSAMETATVANMKTALNALYGANQYSLNAVGTLAVDEGVDGALNAFCIAWPWSIPALHVSEVIWRKVA